MANPIQVQFDAVILKQDHMDATYIPIEFDVEKTFGKKRLKVKVWFDDVLYRGLLAKYAGGYHLLINKTIRAQLGKDAGDSVRVLIQEDTEERILETPQLLKVFFRKEKGLKFIFDKMSYTHRKEYIDWLTGAKKEDTLQNRLIKFKELLSAQKM
jgi:hypothetical protein